MKSGRDVDKFKEMNLHACDGVNVSCPAIEESPVNVECKVKQVVELGSHHMFIAEVVGVQISDEYKMCIRDRHIYYPLCQFFIPVVIYSEHCRPTATHEHSHGVVLRYELLD